MVSLLIAGAERSCEADPPATITVGRRSVREDGQPQYAAIVLSGPHAAIADNLLTPAQASAETGIEGLVATNECTVSHAAGDAAHGTGALLATATGEYALGAGTTRDPFDPYRARAEPGTLYTAAAAAKSADVPGVCVQLIFWSALGLYLDSITGAETACQSWTELPTVTMAAPAGTAYASVEILAPGPFPIGAVVLADKLGLWEGAGGAWAMPGATLIAETGQAVTIADGLGPRHTGRITDAAVTHDDDGAVQKLTSVGALAEWGRQRIGDEPWPQESVADRAQRIAGLVGLPLIVEGGRELQVVARDVDSKRGIEVLAELAKSTGGWLYDDGAGIVHLQALDARDVTTTTVLWAQEPAGATWADLDDVTWAEEDQPGPYAPIVLDCTQVDWEPEWTQTLGFVNIVSVTWGPKGPDGNQPAVIAIDQASIDDLGESPVTIKSQLADPGDATELAGLILRRSARPRWHLDAVKVDAAGLDPQTLRLLSGALPGTRCTITGLPQPAPHGMAAFPGVIEGWTETINSETDRRLALWLSHVEESLAVPTWGAEPPGETWAQLDPTLTWENDL